MELVEKKPTDAIIERPEKFDRETLEYLMYGIGLSGREISELYGKDPSSGKYKYSPWQVYNAAKKWEINEAFIKSRDLVAVLEKMLDEVDVTIQSYESAGKAKYRKIEGMLKSVIGLSEKVAIKINLTDDEIFRIKKMLVDDISLLDMQKLQQKDQDIIHGYQKLKIEIVRELRNVRELQLEEVDAESLLVMIHNELWKVDEQNNYETQFASSFKVHIKKKMFEKIGMRKLAVVKEVAKIVKKSGDKIVKSKDKKYSEAANDKRKVKAVALKKKCNELTKKYDVHYCVAQYAVGLEKEHADWEESHRIEAAKVWAASRYDYIGLDGKSTKGNNNHNINKKEENNNETDN